MRLICAIVALALLSGCASHRNRPVQPSGQYWPINKEVPIEEKANG